MPLFASVGCEGGDCLWCTGHPHSNNQVIRHVLLAALLMGSSHAGLQASSVRAPALLECVAAMAASPNLAPVLAGQQSVRPGTDGPVTSGAGQQEGCDEGEVSANLQLGHK